MPFDVMMKTAKGTWGSSMLALPVGKYHSLFFGYRMMGLRSYNQKVEHPKRGLWHEPSGRALSGS